MVIDQRNAGASVANTVGVIFPVDRFGCYGDQASKFTGQQSSTAPAGFINSLIITSSSAYSVPAGEIFLARQRIEGLNVADLGWGTANAATVTLSFWVRSSLTGTFGGSLQNSAQNRSYPFTYTISAANTFEQKTITVAGDTSGTWLTTSGVGITVNWGLGVGSTYSGTAGAWSGSTFYSATGATSVVGTSGATFYITGVQLEKGSTATSFDYRPYGTELMLCQYYLPAFSYNMSGTACYEPIGMGSFDSAVTLIIQVRFPRTARVPPTGILVSAASDFLVRYVSANYAVSAISLGVTGINAGLVTLTTSGGSAGACGLVYTKNTAGSILFTGCEL